MTAATHLFVRARNSVPRRNPEHRRDFRSKRSWAALGGIPLLAAVVAAAVFIQPASATSPVQLGTAAPFGVLAGTAVTDVPTSSITGDAGLSPAAGTNYTGLSHAQVDGSIYTTDGTGPAGNVNDPALLTTAKNDLTTAYGTAAGLPPTSTFTAGDNQLGGHTLTAGVYAFGHASTANITAASPLVLNGEGNPNAVFVFQASSDLVTGSGSVVRLENDAQACNVFWQVSSSATLNSSSTFVGTIMALTSITLGSDATVQGRVLARNGEVSLDANTITVPSDCATTTTTTTTAGGTTPTTTPSGTTPTTAPGGTTATTAPGGSGGSGSGSGSGSGGSGATGSITNSASTSSGEGASGTGSAAGVSSTSSAVPVGAPHTGFGGAAHSDDPRLIGLGGTAVAASIGLVVLAASRRRGRRRSVPIPPVS